MGIFRQNVYQSDEKILCGHIEFEDWVPERSQEAATASFPHCPRAIRTASDSGQQIVAFVWGSGSKLAAQKENKMEHYVTVTWFSV